MGELVIAYDIGTTALKTCMFEITDTIKLLVSAVEGYELILLDNGGVEQNPNSWWNAMCKTTRKVIEESKVDISMIKGISFCAQMQGLVLVDKDGQAIRNAMSYMDIRAKKEYEEGLKKGLKLNGLNIYKTLKSLYISGAVAASVKDPVWKYKWVQNNEPNNFEKIYKWLDVKEFLICKCTGNFIMTEDSAFATLLFDTRVGKKGFSKILCNMLGVNLEHLSKVVKSTDIVGYLTKNASVELGLNEGTIVFGGGGDASLIGIGAGATKENQTHIYFGTSGWVSTVVRNKKIDLKAMIASIIGARENYYNYFAEMETAGKCLEWVKDHLALDEIGIYLKTQKITDLEEEKNKSLYEYMMDTIQKVPAGSKGIIFTPWLLGNRCPFEDSNARAMFYNISLDTGKTELIHAVIEGICYHLRWMLEACEKNVKIIERIRFVGGGALEPITCQILSDVIGREIETVADPQNIGAVGAAVTIAIGLGIIDGFDDVPNLIPTKNIYTPNNNNKLIYDKYFKVFKALYKNNKDSFNKING